MIILCFLAMGAWAFGTFAVYADTFYYDSHCGVGAENGKLMTGQQETNSGAEALLGRNLGAWQKWTGG